jgi:hypothetical protein
MTEPNFAGLSFFEKLKRRKIRNYLFLDKRLQFDFAALLAVVGAFNAIYFSALVFFHTRESFLRLSAYVPDYLLSEDFFKDDYKLFLTTVAFAVIGEAVFIGLLGLFFSHRIAGPLYAMSLKLQSIAKGQVPDLVRLRKNDFLVQFADKLNAAISILGSNKMQVAAALEDLKAGRKAECEAKLMNIMASEPASATSEPDASTPQG